MLFDRVYTLLIGKKGETRAVEISNVRKGPALRIEFEIKKDSKKNPNAGRISVYNLVNTTRTKFEEPNARVSLSAGYREEAGPLMMFAGDVTHVSSLIEKAEISTIFELGEGYRAVRDSVISKGYAPGVTSKEVLTDLSKSMSLPLTLPPDAPEYTWKNGLSYYGSSRVLMDKVTSAAGLEWSVQAGNLQVVEKNGVTTRQGILISDSSGMIGSPVRVRKAKVEKSGNKTEVVANTESEDGWKVKTLLMPMLNPGDRVILESIVAEGIFRIQDIKHTGDSHGGDWMSEMTLVNPNKPLGKDTAKSKGNKVKAKAKRDDNDE
jgi:hypothetical protein